MKKIQLRSVTWLFFTTSFLFSLPALSKEEEIKKSYSVSAGGNLVLESERGSINVDSWDKSQVEVLVIKKARNQEKLKDFKVTFEKQGDTITIQGDGAWGSRVNVEYKIKVPQTFNLNLKTGGGSIEVGDLSGIIKLDTSGGSIKVGNVKRGSVDVDTSGGSIEVGDVNGDLKAQTSGGSIHTGKVTGESLVDTSGGSIRVEGGGKQLKAETSGGSVRVGPSDGNVDVDTSGGSIRIEPTKGNVKAVTSGGSIKIDNSSGEVFAETSGGSISIGGSVGLTVAETGGGSIKIENAKGAIEALTGGGSIIAEMIETDKQADTHIKLKTSGGSITLFLPKNLAASISADLKITHYGRRDYRIYSDFPLVIKGKDSDEVTANGDINGGGDKIELMTTNGDITIKMLDD